MEDSLASFLNHLRIERALSQNTISAYERDLRLFSHTVGKEWHSISTDDVEQYLQSLTAAGRKHSSVNRILSALKSFYSYLERELGRDNPVRVIPSLKTPQRLPKALSVADVLSLIDNSWSPSDISTLRDRALVELLYGTGARVSEVVGINLSDIERRESDDGPIATIKLRGKGSKERIVPVGSYAQKALDDYLVRVRPGLMRAKANSALFLNKRGGRLSRVSAWNIVSQAAQRAGISHLVSPHVFRHSYATHLLDGGADIRVVQELLGHASVTTTQIYTLITLDKVRESYMTAHPRGK